MQCLTKLWCLQKADFMNTRTKNRSKNRKTMALCFTRTIMIRHWVVNWRANRLKDVLTRDRTVHYFFFREWNAYGLMNMKKGTRFPSTVLNWVQKLHALIVMVNSGGPVLPYRKWQVALDKKSLSIASTWVSEWLYVSGDTSVVVFFAASSLPTARPAKLYLSWIQCSHLGRQRFWFSSP